MCAIIRMREGTFHTAIRKLGGIVCIQEMPIVQKNSVPLLQLL